MKKGLTFETKSMQNDKINGLIIKLFFSSIFILKSLFSFSFLKIFKDLVKVFPVDGGGVATTGAFSVIHEFNNPHKVFLSSSYIFLLK